MPRLLHDRPLALAGFVRRGGEPRTQRVAREQRRVEAGLQSPPLDDEGHALARQARRQDLAEAARREVSSIDVKLIHL
jgi:hypothetical protein